MNLETVEQLLIDLFTNHYPKINVETVSSLSIGKILLQSSTLNLQQFVDFEFRDNCISQLYFGVAYTSVIKKLFSVNKIQAKDLNIIQNFLDTINSNLIFNKSFRLINNMQIKNILRSYKKADVMRLPFMTEHTFLSNFICKTTGTFYRFRIYNHFKLSRTGKFFAVPMIHFFEDCDKPQLFAFNIYAQTIHKVTAQSFYFEDFFIENQLFNPDMDVDILVNTYIDNELLTRITDVSVQEIIQTIPLSDIDKKVELVAMYFI